MEKKDCRSCKYRYSLPGNAHIRCALGSVSIKRVYRQLDDNESVNAFVKRLARSYGFDNVKDNGIKNHWCYFPFVFDPIWLEGECRYYQEEKLIFSTTKKEGQ